MRYQVIKNAINIAQAQFLNNLKILKLLLIVKTFKKHIIPLRIAILVIKRVSEFKRVFNRQEEIIVV